jgi:hypothetical protein
VRAQSQRANERKSERAGEKKFSSARRLIRSSLALLSLLPSLSFASFEELPTGARQAGLGNAFTALADDVYSTYYNPAGLAQLHRSEFTAYYAKLYSGLTDGSSIGRNFVAYGHPTAKRGTFGISYLSLSLADLYSESTFGFHYAQAIREKWNLGGSIKFLKKSFGSDIYTENAINSDSGQQLNAPDPLFAKNGSSKSAASFDMGAQYRISKIYGVGLAILNVNSPNMALSPSDTDKVAAVYKAGLARRTKTSSVDAEISAREFTSREYRFNMGGERWLRGGFGIRGGLGFGQRQYQVTSIGFSYRWESLQFDYALIYPLTGIKGTFGTNQLSMTFRFGRKN